MHPHVVMIIHGIMFIVIDKRYVSGVVQYTHRHRNAKLVVHNYSYIIMSKVVHEHSVKGVFYLLDSIVLHILIFISLLVTLHYVIFFSRQPHRNIQNCWL